MPLSNAIRVAIAQRRQSVGSWIAAKDTPD